MSTEQKPSYGRLADGFSAWLIAHPFLALLFALLLVVGTGSGWGKLNPDFTHRGFFQDDDPLSVEFDEFERRFGNDDAVVVVMRSKSGIFDAESLDTIMKLTEELWLVPEVIRVTTLSNFNWVHATGDDIEVEPLIPDDQELTPALIAERKKVALEHEDLPGWLINEKGDTTMMFAAIKPGIDKPPDTQTIVLAVRELLEKHAGSDHEFHITGGPAINFGFKEATERDLYLNLVVILFVIIFLIGSFRSVKGVLLPLLVVFCSVSVAMATSGWLSVKITSITSIIPQILIAIGVADAVHILQSYYAARRRGESGEDAAHYALAKNFKPTLLTSVSTAAGFVSFTVSEIVSIAGLGLLATVGSLVAWVLTYLLLAVFLRVLPGKVKTLENAPTRDGVGKRSAAFTEKIYALRVPIIGGFVLLGVATIAIALSNRVNSDPFLYFEKGFWLREASDFVEENLGGAMGVELVVDSGQEDGIKDPEFLATVDEFQQWVASQPGVTNTTSIVDILKQMNRSLHGGTDDQYKLATSKAEIGQQLFLYTMSLPQGMDVNDRVTIKNDSLRISALTTLHDSASAVAAYDSYVAKGKEMGLTVTATGKGQLYQRMNGYVVRSFVTSASIAMVLISLLLVFFLGSIRLGLLALIPNVIPLMFGGAVLRMMGQPLDVGSVLVTSICLGIAVDDTIHFIANYNRWRQKGYDAKESVNRVLTHTLPALVVTTTVLVVSFAMFAFATFVPNFNLGVLTATVLGFALFTDVTLLPALLMVRDKQDDPQPVGATTPAAASA